MFRSSLPLGASALDGRSPLAALLSLAALFGLCVGIAAIFAYDTATLPLVVFGAAVMATGFGIAHSYPHPVLGACNAVTLARVAMVAFLAGAVGVADAHPWVVFSVAALAFALDGVDGWLARRSGLVSGFGARFDMETDAGLGAILSLWLLVSGTAGPEILILGFMRYAFVAAAYVTPSLRAPLPESLRRKAICVVQIATLIILACPLSPAPVAAPLGAVAALLLSASFVTDILWLARRAG